MELESKPMVSRRSFLVLTGALALSAAGLAGCEGSRSQSSSEAETSSSSSDAGEAASSSAVATADSAGSTSDAASSAGSKSIVCCFSHAGENYGVGYVEEGNTEVVAKIIAGQTNADLFMIEPVEDYPQGYDECCDVALEEQNAGARPEVKGVPDNWDAYDTVYLGYPIWWGDMPQCLYTFVEQLDWADKDVRPFNTHAGSGAAGVPATLRELCAGATVGEALGIWSFVDLGMPGYLSLSAQFAFADAEKPLALSLVQFAAVGSTIAAASSLVFDKVMCRLP